MSRNIYRYTIGLNLYHPVFDDYHLRVNLDAVHAELESEHFDSYEPCVDDCNKALEKLKTYLETEFKVELVQGWEPNPSRNKDPNVPHLTPANKWDYVEIIHIFLFQKDEEEITEKTIPAVSCSVLVENFDEELLDITH